MIQRFKQFIGLIFCIALVWTSGDCDAAALGLNQSSAVRLQSDRFYFTEQALVQRLIFPSRVNPGVSQGHLCESLGLMVFDDKEKPAIDGSPRRGRILEGEESVPSILPWLLSKGLEEANWDMAMRELQFVLQVRHIPDQLALYIRKIESNEPKLMGAFYLDNQMIRDAEKDVSGARTAAYDKLLEQLLYAKLEFEHPGPLPPDEMKFLVQQEKLKILLKEDPEEREAVRAYWAHHPVYAPVSFSWSEFLRHIAGAFFQPKVFLKAAFFVAFLLFPAFGFMPGREMVPVPHPSALLQPNPAPLSVVVPPPVLPKPTPAIPAKPAAGVPLVLHANTAAFSFGTVKFSDVRGEVSKNLNDWGRFEKASRDASSVFESTDRIMKVTIHGPIVNYEQIAQALVDLIKNSKLSGISPEDQVKSVHEWTGEISQFNLEKLKNYPLGSHIVYIPIIVTPGPASKPRAQHRSRQRALGESA